MRRGLEPLCSVSKPSIKASERGGREASAERGGLDKNGRNGVAPVRRSDEQIPGVLCLLEELERPGRFLWKNIFRTVYMLPRPVDPF